MPLARWLKKPNNWARIVEPSAWNNGDFPISGVVELEPDPDGSLSFYEIASHDDPMLRRVIADRVVRNAKFEAAMWVFVDPDIIAKLGLSVEKTPGDNSDLAVKEAHRDLHLPSGQKAIQLLHAMATSPTKEFKKADVMICVAESLRANYIDLSAAPNKEKILKELLAEGLIDASAIRTTRATHPQPKSAKKP